MFTLSLSAAGPRARIVSPRKAGLFIARIKVVVRCTAGARPGSSHDATRIWGRGLKTSRLSREGSAEVEPA
jgi:hypothetical protein